MKLLDAMQSRRSIRSFWNEPIPEEDLKTILEAGAMAPSAKNRQPWNFTVLSQTKEIRAVVDCFEKRLEQIGETSPVGRGGESQTGHA